jgi:hypothetical protein
MVDKLIDPYTNTIYMEQTNKQRIKINGMARVNTTKQLRLGACLQLQEESMKLPRETNWSNKVVQLWKLLIAILIIACLLP